MANERLRGCLAAAELTTVDLAAHVGVDVKTVERWIAKGRVPYRSHRTATTALLRTTEAFLWPEVLDDPRAASTRRAEPAPLYPNRGAVPAELSGIVAESFEWTEDTEIARIAAFDVGIMPLHDTPWERGKCAYKLLQVMAAGKPVIASPVGANRQVVRHGVNGFLAETTQEGTAALRKLADPELRRRMGEEARRTVAEQYASAVIVPRLASILSEAAAA